MQKKIPQRQCMGCRERKAKRELIRVVRTPEGDVKLDFSGKMNGRGAYICPQSECLKKAIRSKALDRSLGDFFLHKLPPLSITNYKLRITN